MSILIDNRALTQAKGHIAGTHRTRAPADTFAAYSRWMPHFGITRLANVTGLDRIGLPVYVAIRPNARSLAGPAPASSTTGSCRPCTTPTTRSGCSS